MRWSYNSGVSVNWQTLVVVSTHGKMWEGMAPFDVLHGLSRGGAHDVLCDQGLFLPFQKVPIFVHLVQHLRASKNCAVHRLTRS